MHLSKILLENFRNFKDLVIEFPPEGAIFIGANGSGKTNILEAIYLLCTGRSQRGATKSEIINYNANKATVVGEFISSGKGNIRKTSNLSFDRLNNVEMKINIRKISSFVEWFGSQAIVSFATSDIQLVYGSPEDRRKFLDIFISLSDKEYLNALIQYRKSLSLRNAILKNTSDNILCRIYEENMAETGSIITQKRIETVHELAHYGIEIFKEISGSKEDYFIAYEPDFKHQFSSKNAWKNVFYTMLAERRKTDQNLGFSSCGPHRDDIHFFINKKQAKSFASQGQNRSLVLSLKLSSALYLKKKLLENIIIIFDDAVSELDPYRTAKVYSIIEKKGQLFIASPHRTIPSLIDSLKQFNINEGEVTVL